MDNRLKMIGIILIVCISVKANDGAYLSRGSVIYPINETKISLKKEILSFNVVDRVSQVNIYFEFFNPEQTERKILVGFQAPYPSGDLSYSLSSNTLISDFKVIKDGSLLPYKIKYSKCENCELKDTLILQNPEEYGIYVYLFEVNFKPGKNIVFHSYDFPASRNVVADQIYRYILTTGSKWAGDSIKDFTLQIDMGKNSYFYVNDIFPKNAEWTIVGTGKIGQTNTSRPYWVFKMVRILSGKLEISAKDFIPTNNLDFGIAGPYSYNGNLSNKDGILESNIRTANFLTMDLNRLSFTKDELLILRNAVYAFHGYQFKNKDLLNYFSNCDWYIPDLTLTSDKIILSEKEQKFIDDIIEKSK
jgi:hypothetical protein